MGHLEGLSELLSENVEAFVPALNYGHRVCRLPLQNPPSLLISITMVTFVPSSK